MFSASIATRSSTYDYIHNKKRNKLEVKLAEKLVYIFSNLRLMKKLLDVGYEEECWSWEDLDDNSDS